MDYKTRPTSREELRTIAKMIRQAFGCKTKLRFDVVDAFERTHEIFPFITTSVVEDNEIPDDIPARCIPDYYGFYLIEVKETVYEGAVRGIGGYRAHILHEICHAILCRLGFTPILERTFRNNELKAYESMEWQAKVLCGEIMVPYEETKEMSVSQIRFFCQVSQSCAQLRVNEFRKNKTKGGTGYRKGWSN